MLEMEMFVVQTTKGAMIVEADRMKVRDGALVFSTRGPLWQAREFLVFARGEWSACHLANSYWNDESGKFKSVKLEDVARLVRAAPDT